MSMKENSDNNSVKSIRTWEIADDEVSTQRGSIAEDLCSDVGTGSNLEKRKPVIALTPPKTNTSHPIVALPSYNISSRVSQQPQGESGWFLVRWMSVFVALWMSLFSWIGRCVGIRTDHPLPTLPVDTTIDSVSFSMDGAGSVMSAVDGTDGHSLNTSVLTHTSAQEAKAHLENYCLLIKRQLASKEIVVSSRDKKKLEKKCDYLLQWIDRNPYAKRDDYLRGLDDVMRYSDKLSTRPPTTCPVM